MQVTFFHFFWVLTWGAFSVQITCLAILWHLLKQAYALIARCWHAWSDAEVVAHADDMSASEDEDSIVDQDAESRSSMSMTHDSGRDSGANHTTSSQDGEGASDKDASSSQTSDGEEGQHGEYVAAPSQSAMADLHLEETISLASDTDLDAPKVHGDTVGQGETNDDEAEKAVANMHQRITIYPTFMVDCQLPW